MSTHPLRRFRQENKVSLVALAAKANITRTSLWRIETGRQTPSLGLVERLVSATDGRVTANDFLSTERSAA